MPVNSWIINYSPFIFLFDSGKEGEKLQKFEQFENKKTF